jgi:ABC-type phosphate transport system permease subunit
MQGRYFPDNLGLLALFVGTLLSQLLSVWLSLPIAYGLGFFFGTLTLVPFARKHQITFRRLFALACAAAGVVMVGTLIFLALGLAGRP